MTKRLVDLLHLNDAIEIEEKIERVSQKEIAIIGISANLPMADNIQGFWENIKNRPECTRDLPLFRKKDADNYQAYRKPGERASEYAKIAYLNEIDKFDYKFFQLSPKEASLIDPNQRLFLETAFGAIEDAGYGGNKLAGSRTGVYIGHRADDFYDYRKLILDVEPESAAAAFIPNLTSIMAGRISYLLDLKGPSLTVDTACSASLVALHLACQAIKNRECDMAIAGGVRINIFPLAVKDKLGIESSDGRAKTFDDTSDGTGIGEGVIAVLLKPLSKALRDGDNIYAVIKGSAVNQDGSSAGMTAPNVLSQEDVILRAWKDAGIDPETISYIEAHGTGTKLGDPIEIEAIQSAFMRHTTKKQFCAIASVKTNLGHLDNLAGMAGLIHAVIALKNRMLPPNFHFNKPNSRIGFENSPVYVNDKLREWDTDCFPRRCGVSSFGLSGTNCHFVLEEAPKCDENLKNDNSAFIITISAKSDHALKELIKKYSVFMGDAGDKYVDDICYTANTGRGHYGSRLAITFKGAEDLREKLKLLCSSDLQNIEEKGVYFKKHKVVADNKQATNNEEVQQSKIRELGETAAKKIRAFTNTGKTDTSILEEVCQLYVSGASINWEELYKDEKRKRVSVPTYPFERNRCWIDISTDISKSSFYKPTWRIQELDREKRNSSLGTILVFKDEKGIGEELVIKFRQDGRRVVEVSMGDNYQKVDENRFLIGKNEEDYRKLLEALKDFQLSQIIHLMSVMKDYSIGSLEVLKELQEKGIYSLLYLSKNLAGNPAQKLELVLVSENVAKVTEEQKSVNPLNGLLFGMGKTVHWELPNIKCRCIDIDDLLDMDNLRTELQCEVKEFKTAYRNNARYVEELEKADFSDIEEAACKFKDTGVYIITGGTGGIGLEIGKYLAVQNRVKIALVNRKAIPARENWNSILRAGKDALLIRRIQAILQMEEAGASVHLYSIDVSNESDVRNLISDLKERFGRINGIIHGAGVGEGDLIGKETKDSLHRVLSPKVEGTWLLDRYTSNEKMDFFILMSSAITLIGKVGGGSYTAANSFLDAFSQYRETVGRKTLAVNWPRWKNTGILAGVDIDSDKEIFRAIEPADAIRAFDKLLGKKASNIFAGEINFEGQVFELGDYLPFKLSEALNNKNSTQNTKIVLPAEKKTVEVKLTGKESGEYTDIEKKIACIWRDKLGFEEMNLNDNFFEIGGDSIMITKVHAMIEKEFPGKVTVADLFLYPTITELAGYISSGEQGIFAGPMRSEKEKEDGMDEQINGLLDAVGNGSMDLDRANQLINQWRLTDDE